MKFNMGRGALFLGALLVLSSCGRNNLPTETVQSEPLASTRMDSYYGGYGNWWGWGGWGQGAVTAFGDYARGIGFARYMTAQANYQNALAAQEFAQANAYSRLMRSMWIDLRRLESEKYRIARARKALDDRARSLNGIAMGKLQYAKSSLLYFSALPGFASLKVVADNETVGPFAADVFSGRTERTRYVDGKVVKEKVEIEPFNGGSLYEFVSWLAVKGYDVKVTTTAPGTAPGAWQLLMSIRAQLQEQIALTDKALKEEAKQDTADIIKIWGESIWGSYGNGLLKDYSAQIQHADNLRK